MLAFIEDSIERLTLLRNYHATFKPEKESDYKVEAYDRALTELEMMKLNKYKVNNISGVDIFAEIEKMNIGKKIKDKLIEILTTSELQEYVKLLKLKTILDIASDIEKIPGFGPAFVKTMLKKVSDLSDEKINEFSNDKVKLLTFVGLNNYQEKMLKYHDHMPPFSTKVAYRAYNELKNIISTAVGDNKFIISAAGSLFRSLKKYDGNEEKINERRKELFTITLDDNMDPKFTNNDGSLFHNDIDIFVYYPEKKKGLKLFTKMINSIQSNTKYIDTLLSGDRTISFIWKLRKGTYTQVDIKISLEDEYIFGVLYFIAGKDANKRYRKLAKKKGYKLNQYEMISLSTNKKKNFANVGNLVKWLEA